MSSVSFLSQPLYPGTQLPLTLIRLDDWALSTITGVDSAKYLHGQLTADILKLAKNQHVMAAHCDAKGKMWGIMHLFCYGDGFGWITRRSLRQTQLNELKKYAVFSKVTLEADDSRVLLGIAGTQARAALMKHFRQLADEQNPLVNDNSSTLLWFPWPCERFLLLTSAPQAQQLSGQLADSISVNTSEQWLALDIEAGYPLLDSATSNQFLPQACNLQVFGGISFKKGCYTGQEMVSRAKFRGANKRALWYLTGNASRTPVAGEDLEICLGENWRRTGCVLAAAQMADTTLLVQAILNNDLAADSVLRVRDAGDGRLHIMPLPYSLQETAKP